MQRRLFNGLLGVGIAAVLLGLAGAVRAGPIYSNFGAGQSYDTNDAWFVGNDGLMDGGTLTQANTFTTASSALLGSITLALTVEFPGGLDEVNIALETDASGSPSGTSLESWTGVAVNTAGLTTVTDIDNVTLAANTAYWVVVSSTDGGSSFIGWNWNDQGAMATVAQSDDGGSNWSLTPDAPQGAFELDPQPNAVPEPSTLALLGIGGLGLFGYGFRRRR